MKAALISLGSKSSVMIASAMKNYFETVEDIDLRKLEINLGSKLDVLYDGKEIGEFDCVYCRGSFRYAPLLKSAYGYRQYLLPTANLFPDLLINKNLLRETS